MANFLKSIAFALLGGQLCIIDEIKKLEKLNNKIYNTCMHIGAVCACMIRGPKKKLNGEICEGKNRESRIRPRAKKDKGLRKRGERMTEAAISLLLQQPWPRPWQPIVSSAASRGGADGHGSRRKAR